MKKGDALALVNVLYILLFVFMLIVFTAVNKEYPRLDGDLDERIYYFGNGQDVDITLINILKTKVDDRKFAEFIILNKDDKDKIEDKARELISKNCVWHDGNNFDVDKYNEFLRVRYGSCRYLFKVEFKDKKYVFGTVPIDDEFRTEDIPENLRGEIISKDYLFVDKAVLNYPGNVKFTLLYELGKKEVKLTI